MTQIAVQKVNSYVAIHQNYVGDLTVQKINSYAVIQVIPDDSLSVEKTTAYLVLYRDNTGNVRQLTDDYRPVYREGTVPYIDFDGDNKYLTIEIDTSGVYTMIFYKEDQTFLVQRKYIQAGTFSIPKINFNQLHINKGRMRVSDILAIQAEMITRAGG